MKLPILVDRCYSECIHYGSAEGGCLYDVEPGWGSEVAEKVEPGERCLHPEHKRDKLIVIPVIELCALLEGSQK